MGDGGAGRVPRRRLPQGDLGRAGRGRLRGRRAGAAEVDWPAMAEASGRGHGISEEGGKAVGRRVRLPKRRPAADQGLHQRLRAGRGHRLRDRAAACVIFREPIMKEDLSQLGAAPQARSRPRPRRQLPEERDRRRRVRGRRQDAAGLRPAGRTGPGLTRSAALAQAGERGDPLLVLRRRCRTAARRPAARLSRKWRSCSQVKPMPPWTWIDALQTSQAASEARAFAIAAAIGSDSGSASAAQAAE